LQCYKDSQCFVYETFKDETAFYAKKGLEFFQQHGARLKRQRYFAGSFHQEHRYHYEVALEIAKQKTHMIGETFVKPSLLKTLAIPLREASEAKMRRISLSSDRLIVQRCISDLLEDVKDQVLNESISNVFFSSG